MCARIYSGEIYEYVAICVPVFTVEKYTSMFPYVCPYLQWRNIRVCCHMCARIYSGEIYEYVPICVPVFRVEICFILIMSAFLSFSNDQSLLTAIAVMLMVS